MRIYQTNHLNLTMNYTVCVANIDFILFFTLTCLAEIISFLQCVDELLGNAGQIRPSFFVGSF